MPKPLYERAPGLRAPITTLLPHSIANCVGRANMRNFLLFLVWTVTAAAFAGLQGSLLMYMQVSAVLVCVCVWGGGAVPGCRARSLLMYMQVGAVPGQEA